MSDEPTHQSRVAPSSTRVEGELPPLMRDRAFWGMNFTQFLGAFNDNLFKQRLLLLATPGAAEAGEDKQWIALAVMAAAFLLFSGFAGWLADRTVKRKLIIGSKVAEIAVMALGLAGFFYYDTFGLTGLMLILFLMSVQSAFFGPPKYGILPEMLHDHDLPKANGLFLMFTFLAIIFGTALIALFGTDPATAWRVGVLCIVVAVIGTLTSTLVRPTGVANPGAPLKPSDLFVPPEMIRLVMRDKQLLLALIVTSSFWMLGGMVQSGVNSLGKTQLGLGSSTSILTAMLGVGIPIGCVVGGKLSQDRINPRVVVTGAVGIVITLVLLSLPGGPQNHLLGFWGSVPVLIILGFCTGMFVVPIQVSLQVRPPAEDKGRMIALMNQVNWVGILLGALLFGLVMGLLEDYDLPRNLVFLSTAAIMLPIALFYRPEELQLGE
ncbi:Lysophospholipid transporter LplT [Posidoniimonas polymericola]|uniref:Lysophospholipid transporter LplT n=1 Tax=Posidoniimonas polymericola TaxID=2528002 RepID=A0A5C5XUB2_9BACT|nr:MFS transporter [Posidoniimonas polymericola]TWT66817.1 Lysophospholipid transporter LplT [Posidoniimonas polymericola]